MLKVHAASSSEFTESILPFLEGSTSTIGKIMVVEIAGSYEGQTEEKGEIC